MSANQPLVIDGREIQCPMCQYNRFWTRRTLMNSRGASFFNFDWANKAADNYICERCGHVLWFLRR